jgi:hypothetical protein
MAPRNAEGLVLEVWDAGGGTMRRLTEDAAVGYISHVARTLGRVAGPLLIVQNATAALPDGRRFTPRSHTLLIERGGRVRSFQPGGSECGCARGE